MVHGVSVIWFPVEDIDRAVGFYRDVLGLEVKHQDGEWAHLEAGGVGVGLNARESPAGSGGGVLAFEPEDGLDAGVTELEERGVEFAGVSEHPWGRVASFQDPDGNDLQLYEPPAG